MSTTTIVMRTLTPRQRGMRRFLQNKLAVFGIMTIALFLLFCFVGPLIHPTDQIHTDLRSTMLPPELVA